MSTAPTPPESGGAETVVVVGGQDWDQVVEAARRSAESHVGERIVVNMGPQHPSTHGVLRLILEIEGETIVEARCGIGYLHTGIEKNLEYRNWTQGVTFVTRMDYLSPLFNETVYCLGVEKLLDITDDIPERASVIRVMMMEMNRISSHLVALATGGMELGSMGAMFYGFREREQILSIFETITGLRMNNAYVRPGGVAMDLPDEAIPQIRDMLQLMPKRLKDLEDLLSENYIWKARTQGIGYLDLSGCMALGITGPCLRSTGLPHDLRRAQPYCGYETYDFDVITDDACDSYGRYLIRVKEMHESLKIIEQCVERLKPGPVMIQDKKIAWPADLKLGPDGLGNSPEHIAKIMGHSMEGLIHHFKLVTEGIRVPAGQVYVAVESPRGELGVHMVSDGGTRPYRVHYRDPSFNNLQAVAAMCEGGMVADAITAVASIDPVMGGWIADERLREEETADERLREETAAPMSVFLELGQRPDEPGPPIQGAARYPADVTARLAADAETIVAKYPQPRSALLPLLHLVQSEDGYLTPAGIAFCAATLDLTAAEVTAVATFYSMYRRTPTGDYLVGVCTNTLCAVMGGDAILDALQDYLGVHAGETTEDGRITLEHVECNAACDYAPVVMVNWDFFDKQTPSSARELVDGLRAGQPPTPTRGAPLCTFKETARVLAGLFDPEAAAAQGPVGDATLAGLRVAREQGMEAPAADAAGTPPNGASDVKAAAEATKNQSAPGPAATVPPEPNKPETEPKATEPNK